MHSQSPTILPPLQVNISGTPAPGHILITPSDIYPSSPYPNALMILDQHGNLVFYKTDAVWDGSGYASTIISDFALQPSGQLSFASMMHAGNAGYYALDSTLVPTDSLFCDSIYTDLHESVFLPDGSKIALCTDFRPADLSNYTTINGVQGASNGEIKGNIIRHTDAQGNILFEWYSLDHYQATDTYFEYFRAYNHLDHTHTNSIEYLSDGNYLISSRNLNEVTKVSAATGQIIWHLGGKNNDFTFVIDTLPFTAQHFAREMDNGNILLFDNASMHANGIARAVEYQLDTVNMTATKVWEYFNPFGVISEYMGNAQRLANGNTFIDWTGTFPTATTTSITEVTSNGTEVFSIDLPGEWQSYRAVKAELPFTLPQPDITCNGNTLQLSAPAGFDQYYWSTGDSTESISISATGTYQVFVNYGIGFLGSKPFTIHDLNNICATVEVATTAEQQLLLYPNPAMETVVIEGLSSPTEVFIYDATGRLLRSWEAGPQKSTLDLSGLAKGYHIIKAGTMSRPLLIQ